MGRNYYSRLFGVAAEMTTAPTGIPGMVGVLFGIFSVVLTLVFLVYFGLAEVAIEEVGVLIASTASFIVLVILFFMINCFRAAPFLDKEKQIEINHLNKQIFDRRERQVLLDELWELRSEGIALRNESVSPKTLETWKSKLSDWRDRVLNVTSKIDVNLYRWVERLDTTTSRVGWHFKNPLGIELPTPTTREESEYDVQNRIASTILDRIAKYLIREFRFTDTIDVNR